MRKVLIAITQSNFGGAQRYVLDLATALKADFEVVVAAGEGGVLLEELEKQGVRTVALSILKRNIGVGTDVRAFFEFLSLLRKEKPDILHLNSSKMGLIGVVAGRLFGVHKIVFTSHGWEFNAPRPVWQQALIAIFSRLIVRFSHVTIAVSNAVKQHMPATLQKKIVVVHNGVGAEQFVPREDARAFLAKKACVPEEGLWVASIAELHPVKGLRYGIEAFAQFAKERADARYFICGEGGEHAALSHAVEKKGLHDSVKFLGFVDEASKYLRAYDIVLIPSLSEGLSYSLLEAGLAGRAVIASNVGGIPEVIENGVSGLLVPAKDEKAIADALTELSKDAERRAMLGRALQECVEKEFSLKVMVQKVQDIYEA